MSRWADQEELGRELCLVVSFGYGMGMGEPITVPPPGFDDLPVEEKIDYVQALWQRIASHPDDVPSPAWHIDVLEKRLDAMRRDGDRGRPWDEVRRDLHARLRAVRR